MNPNDPHFDVRAYNRAAWDEQVARGNRWTLPVNDAAIAAARQGQWSVVLTPARPVPRDWFPEMAGLDVLCLASGGGQRAPLFAAAGALVTVLDNSPRQLEQDRSVADRHGITLATVEGDMRDLSAFTEGSFDLVFHPCSTSFGPQIRPVWNEAFRVLRANGVLLAGFCNPVRYIFDEAAYEQGELQIRHRIPYSDLTSLTEEERHDLRTRKSEPLDFGHSLEDQIGGQLAAGFALTGFYEDGYTPEAKDRLSQFIDTFIATRAVKPLQPFRKIAT